MTDEKKPRLAPGVKLRTDDKRGPVLLGPERVLELDDIALSLQHVDAIAAWEAAHAAPAGE